MKPTAIKTCYVSCKAPTTPKSGWRTASLLFSGLLLVQGFTLIGLYNQASSIPPRKILHAAVTGEVRVSPGQIGEDYVKDVFNSATQLLNSWEATTFESNLQVLFDRYYAEELTASTRKDLQERRYIEKIRRDDLASSWSIDPEKSRYDWCDRVGVTGVACALVAGSQTLRSRGKTVSTEAWAYILLGTNVRPSLTDIHRDMALRVIRIRRGRVDAMAANFDMLKETGVLVDRTEDEKVQ